MSRSPAGGSGSRFIRVVVTERPLPRYALVLLTISLLVGGGCAGVELRESTLTDLRKGVADTKEQARLALSHANQLVRHQSIARVVTLNPVTLREDDFIGAVAPDDVVRWDQAFDLLEQYVGALQFLVSPDRTDELDDAAVAFGEQLQAPNIGVQVPPGLAAAFTGLGQALVEARAQTQALAVMQTTDAELRLLLTGMQDALYDPTTNSGLRATVRSNWQTAINGSDPASPQSRWIAAHEDGSEVERRAIVTEYLELIDARDAQLAALDRIRESLGMLAEAHSRAAQGGADADSLVAWIGEKLDATEAVYARFHALSQAGAGREHRE